jgi:hypothetical protein
MNDMNNMNDAMKAFTKQLQEQREQRTIEHFVACERIRKKLELPPDTLSMIHQMLRDEAKVDLLPRAPHVTTRSPLRILSEKPIKRTDPITGKPTPLSVRPQTTAMRVEEFEILGNPEDWMIADVQVGNRSQFPQAGPPLPGRLFTPSGTCYRFVTETIQTAMDFTLLVHYVGPKAEGDIFEAVAMGSHAS